MNEVDTSILIGVCVWAAIGIVIPWLWCFITACRSGKCIDEDYLFIVIIAAIFWPFTVIVLLLFALYRLIKAIPLLALIFQPTTLGRIVWTLRKRKIKSLSNGEVK